MIRYSQVSIILAPTNA